MTDQIKVRVSAEDEGVVALLTRIAKNLETVTEKQKKNNDETAKASKAHASLAKSVTSTISNLKRLAIAYGAVRAVRFVGDQIEAADALGKLAQKTGASVEALSVLAFAGETADVSMDQLSTAFRAFAKSQDDLQSGNKDTVASFKAIGLAADDLKGLSPDEAFRKVSDAMGNFESDASKAVVAMDIFGKAGTDMIPLLDDLADGGFDDAAKQAALFGRVVSKDAAEAAADFNDQLRLMKSEAQGAALSFGQEVVPALSDVFNVLGDLKGAGELTFAQTLGKGAAAIVRATARIAIFAFKSVGEELGLLARVGVETWQAIKAAARFDFDEAGIHLDAAEDAFAEMKDTAERVWKETGEALDKAEADRAAKTAAARKSREQQEQKRRKIQITKDEGDLAKARADAEENARKSEGDVLAASLALRDQAVERAFAKGLSSLESYFAARQRTIVEAGEQEIAALKASRDAIAKQPAPTPVERVRRDDQVAQKTAQITVAEAKLAEHLVDLDGQRLALTKSVEDTIIDAELKIRQARGDTAAQAKRDLDKEVEDYRLALTKKGQLTQEEIARRTQTFKVTLTLEVDAKSNQERVDQLFAEIDRKRTDLDQRVSLGLQSQASAQKELTAFESARLPTLQALADKMAEFADKLGNPELRAAAADLQVRLRAVGQAATESARLAAEMKTDIANAFQNDLSTFLGSTITQVDSLGEAFADLATSVVSSIQRIVAQLLAAKAVEGIGKLLAGFGGGGGPDIDFAGIAGALTRAGFATGGYTGKGGKYEPAGVVHRDEYVLPREVVRAVGVPALETLRRTRSLSAASKQARAVMQSATTVRTVRRLSRGLPGYADGGLVGGVPSAPQSLSLGGSIALDVSHDGTRVQSADVFLETDAGEKAVLKVIARNRGKLRGIV